MKRLIVLVFGVGIVLASVGCIGRPILPGSAGPALPPRGEAPPLASASRGAAEEPASQGDSGKATETAAVETEPAAESAAAAESEPAATSGSLSEAEYRDKITPLMRRMRELGRDSLNLSRPISSCSSVSEPKGRAQRLLDDLGAIEAELNELSPPDRYARAQDDLGRSVTNQRAFLDLQIEAMDNCSNRSAMADRLQRSSSRLSDAVNAWEDARRTLNVSP